MNEAAMPMATVKKAPALTETIEAAPCSGVLLVPFVPFMSMEVPFISIPPTAWAEVGDLLSVAFLANCVKAARVF